MIDTIRTALLPFSTKTKQEVPEGLQSLKASIEQETETGFFLQMIETTKIDAKL